MILQSFEPPLDANSEDGATLIFGCIESVTKTTSIHLYVKSMVWNINNKSCINSLTTGAVILHRFDIILSFFWWKPNKTFSSLLLFLRFLNLQSLKRQILLVTLKKNKKTLKLTQLPCLCQSKVSTERCLRATTTSTRAPSPARTPFKIEKTTTGRKTPRRVEKKKKRKRAAVVWRPRRPRRATGSRERADPARRHLHQGVDGDAHLDQAFLLQDVVRQTQFVLGRSDRREVWQKHNRTFRPVSDD